MGVSIGKTRRSGMSQINITPMIDVLLVLLVIFMIAEQIMTESIDIQLPREAAQPPRSPPPVITRRSSPAACTG